ncbi:MAG: hypothetical protein A2355_15580 [Spirochaetes bacterium RIFOXYB1_FULL_32_8]|nr:MAG: hypothetical protein A2Y30_09525 [Spirochaetes bacterium GWE1_32_154]OHD79056.1 MAG: hypothetical protein A2355_15580 [Spirochaetes bacterium RIFOXYB1_FULL_32_8]HBI36768.1 hypothetical protein [Spirochaetia bacterium]
MTLTSFRKNLILDFLLILLSFFISILVYNANSVLFEKSISKKVIDTLIKDSSIPNVPGNIIDIVWVTKDFENWLPYFYNTNKYKNSTLFKSMHPNIHSKTIKSITINKNNVIFTVWINKNSASVIFKYLIIPFLLLILFLFIVKLFFTWTLQLLNIHSLPVENIEETNSDGRKPYDLTNDEIEGLIGHK